MKKLKILIIDTNPIINIGFKSIFKNSVIFEVVAFTYKKNEINEIINQQEINLVISEINFKDGDVKDILKLFKKNNIDIPLVVFTSESNENKSINLLKSGASGFITKNLRKKSIKRILQDIAFTKYGSKELNKYTRLKNRFNFDYNTEKLNSLSKRELEVLKLFFRGKRNIEISEKLNINQKTVNTYITRIMKKLEVNSKTDLFLLARKHIKQPY
ncbi:MAG: response regulator transcription factor [Cryomorphaceae bacterium]|nr:response regulator transcription factor [Cryomorphaceae bacterium]MDG1889182.1 response regulator transcription factor [Flavobacteriaceae bacterium]MBT3503308.1 response regulator transcription factor [Cryomorphaceae bacterium]MBT3689670.1 response regulator transcription factor [Cryomorphaceae bacterium]MBT4293238.1 response regulator transcription factor [Cryomorphaceae bacterium]